MTWWERFGGVFGGGDHAGEWIDGHPPAWHQERGMAADAVAAGRYAVDKGPADAPWHTVRIHHADGVSRSFSALRGHSEDEVKAIAARNWDAAAIDYLGPQAADDVDDAVAGA